MITILNSIAVEERLTFETELTRNGIQYYSNTDEQVFIGSEIRYFLRKADRLVIGKEVLENERKTAIELSTIIRPKLS